MAELFNIQDLLSVNVSLNTNKLFAILQTVTDKLSEQEAYIKLLELRIVDVENRQNSTDFKLIELASVPQVVPAEEEKTIDPEEIKAQIDTHLQTLRQEAAEHDKKIIILEQNMRDAVLDAKSKADKTSMEIQSIHTVIRTDREKITQKVAQIYRELRDDLNRVDADVIENNRFLLSEKLPEIKEGVETFALKAVKKTELGLQEDLASLKHISRSCLQKVAEAQTEVAKQTQSMSDTKRTVIESLSNMRNELALGLVKCQQESQHNLKRINTVYTMFSLDMNALNELTNSPPPSPPGNRGSHSPPKRASVAPPESTVLQSILLNTPAFKQIKYEIHDAAKQSEKRSVDHILSMKVDFDSRFDVFNQQLAKAVTQSELRNAVDQCESILIMKDILQKHENSINFINNNHLTRDATWDALRLKADVKSLDLKSDRKFVSSLFDFLNEKLNAIMGENTSEKLMDALKLLENRLQQKADRTELIDSVGPTHKETVPGLDLSNAPLLVARGDLMRESTLNSSRVTCLSCNRPLPTGVKEEAKEYKESPRKTSPQRTARQATAQEKTREQIPISQPATLVHASPHAAKHVMNGYPSNESLVTSLDLDKLKETNVEPVPLSPTPRTPEPPRTGSSGSYSRFKNLTNIIHKRKDDEMDHSDEGKRTPERTRRKNSNKEDPNKLPIL